MGGKKIKNATCARCGRTRPIESMVNMSIKFSEPGDRRMTSVKHITVARYCWMPCYQREVEEWEQTRKDLLLAESS